MKWPVWVFGLLVTGGPATAGEDVQVWTSAGVRYRAAKKVRLEYEQHLRFDQNVSRLESVKPEAKLSWKASDWARLGLGYRYSQERNGQDEWKPEHRFHLQGSVGMDLGPVGMGYRLRFQERLEFGVEFKNKHTLRQRLSAEVDTGTRFTPFSTVEGFAWLRDSGMSVRERWRFTGGVEARLPKRNRVEVFYRREVPVYDGSNPIEHILGVGYQYRIPRKK